MSLTVAFHITADVKAARVEVKGAAEDIRQLGTASKAAAADARTQATAVDGLSRSLVQVEAGSRRAATAQQVQAQAARDLQQANRMAAGATGNLVSQFNDIGMMIAAGQNPLLLAIQQGTQITQAFGNAGAAGAVRMLGAAFVQAVNPLNLITLGARGVRGRGAPRRYRRRSSGPQPAQSGRRPGRVHLRPGRAGPAAPVADPARDHCALFPGGRQWLRALCQCC